MYSNFDLPKYPKYLFILFLTSFITIISFIQTDYIRLTPSNSILYYIPLLIQTDFIWYPSIQTDNLLLTPSKSHKYNYYKQFKQF